MIHRSRHWFARILGISAGAGLAGWLAACSGATTDPVLNPAPGGGSDSGSGGDSSSPAPTRDASSSKCDEIFKQLQDRQEELRACCPTCKSIQCQQLIPDLCCPFSSNANPESAEARQYSVLVQRYRDSGCSVVCTDAICREEPSGRCVGEGSVGTCAQ